MIKPYNHSCMAANKKVYLLRLAFFKFSQTKQNNVPKTLLTSFKCKRI